MDGLGTRHEHVNQTDAGIFLHGRDDDELTRRLVDLIGDGEGDFNLLKKILKFHAQSYQISLNKNRNSRTRIERTSWGWKRLRGQVVEEMEVDVRAMVVRQKAEEEKKRE